MPFDEKRSDVVLDRSAAARSEVRDRAAFSTIRYANVWEDPRVLRGALEVKPGDVVFSIAAAGDNALALLLDDPSRVVALDFNESQLALTALKVAALQALDHPSLLAFLGAMPSRDRLRHYARVRTLLDDSTRRYWDARPQSVQIGVCRDGRFERYLGYFRRFVLPLVQSKTTVRSILAARSLDEQRRIFAASWDNPRWRALFKVFFGKAMLGRLGRDPAFFTHVAVRDVGGVFLARAARALTALPVDDNFFVEAILTGHVTGAFGRPPYLDEANHATLRGRLSRLELVYGSMEAHLAATPPDTYDAYNLSDCFEWMSDAQSEAMLRSIARAAKPGARLAYWNLLVPRRRPAVLASLIEEDHARSAALHAIDRCFFYSDVVVERVK